MNKKSIWESFRRLMRFLLLRPMTSLANSVSSSPKREAVFEALSKLYSETVGNPGHKGEMLEFDAATQPIIIFSDQHKGSRNGADDFALAEPQYLAALNYYYTNGFYYVNLGDAEEFWENNVFEIMKHNRKSFATERLFVDAGTYGKVYGNHDLFWQLDPLAAQYLKQIYGKDVKIFGGIVLRLGLTNDKKLDVFCAHGHQGDSKSDGNWFSAWVVSYIWAPLQIFLRINPNTPSYHSNLKTLHNQMMYEWSAAQKNLVVITGHTHQPVFNSLTHLERLYVSLEEAELKNDKEAIGKINAELPRRRLENDHLNAGFKNMTPSYFNSGCCCYDDGTITGIEIAEGCIRLVKWSRKKGTSIRTVAEEMPLEKLAALLG